MFAKELKVSTDDTFEVETPQFLAQEQGGLQETRGTKQKLLSKTL